MSVLRSLLLLILSLHCCINIHASHLVGGDITYQCLGGDSFLVSFHFYRNCSGVQAPATAALGLTSSCSSSTVTLLQTGYTEVSQICNADLSQSSCSGGSLSGYEVYTYEGVVVLTPCSDWVISYSLCCRSTSNNLTGTTYFYVESTLDNVTAPCNNSPEFTDMTLPFFCNGVPAAYNPGMVESDCDSLVYSLIDAKSSATANVLYNSPYSGTYPIDGVLIDPATGQISFTPTTVGTYVIAMMIMEYRNGLLIGSVIRDITFVVINCTNSLPQNLGGITNLSGGASLVDSNSIAICLGAQFCFQFAVSDPDPGDSIYLSSNVSQVLPGASFSYVPGNPTVAMICWTAVPPACPYKPFIITAGDNACPYYGKTVFALDVNVVTGTYAAPQSVGICQGDSVQLNAYIGNNFVWNSISGDPIIVGSNFSCDSCPNPLVSPSQTSVYEVVSDTSGACSNRDTVTINVGPSFTWSASLNDSAACTGSGVLMSVTPSPAGSYSYQWTPATGLDDPNIASPLVTQSTPGTYTYNVAINNNLGCTMYDTLDVYYDSAGTPSVLITGDSISCGGDSVSLYANVSMGGSCNYTLEMRDYGGNGWDGASIDLYLNGSLYGSYLCLDSLTTMSFPVTQGESIWLDYNPWTFENEHAYILYDASMNILYQDGPNPASGFVYVDVIDCGYSGTFSYQWSPATGLNSTTSDSVMAYVTGNEVYTVVVTNILSGCSDSAQVNVVVVPAPAASTISGQMTVNSGSTENYWTNLNTGSTYLWTVTGGSIANGQGNSVVSVNWGSGGNGTICYQELNTDGCWGPVVCDTVTILPAGIENMQNGRQLLVYPIPSGHQVNIDVPAPGRYHIEIFDLSGRSLYVNSSGTSGTISINLNLSDGSYLLRVSNTEHEWKQALIVITQ